jgi:protein-tyrosine phosphatase
MERRLQAAMKNNHGILLPSMVTGQIRRLIVHGDHMVKQRRFIFFAFLLFALNTAPFWAQAKPEKQAAKETGTRERRIKLEGQPNFRDMGGYRTSDGHTVKWGLIYRSGQLSKLTDADLLILQKLNLRTVVDLRGSAEVESRGKDLLPEGVHSVSYPIDATGNGRAGNSQRAPAAAPAQNADFMLQATRTIMVNRTDVYGSLIRELAAPGNRPLAFHCTQGKDRAGIGAAIILTMLGVPWETVREDYLLTNIYRKEENEKDLKNMRDGLAQKSGVPPEQVDMSAYTPMYYVKPEYIDTARQDVIDKYGSMENYIRQGLGISDELVAQLRKELLE